MLRKIEGFCFVMAITCQLDVMQGMKMMMMMNIIML
jgi:hypothetical protein